jgi:hypothetical protein
MLDDFMNGNISSSGSTFFTGITTLSNQLGNLANNVTNIMNNFTTNLQTGVNNMVTTAGAAVTQIEILADGSTPNATYNLIYSSPTPGSSASVTSAFGAIFGSPNQSNTLSGALYSLTRTIY